MKLSLPSFIIGSLSLNAKFGTARLSAGDPDPDRALMPMDDMDHHMMGSYAPLSCNHEIDWTAQCQPGTATPLSSLVTTPNTYVEIPCGSCVLVDYVDGETVSVAGINVIGKLHFPTGSNLTIRTNHVVVQGIFSSDEAVSPTIIGDDTTSGRVKIVLTEELSGSVDLEFEPHQDNWSACGGDQSMGMSCTESLGRKAFAVLGGLVDVKAVDEACPAWERLKDYTVEEVDAPLDPNLPQPTPGAPPVLTEGCSTAIIDINYKIGDAPPPRLGGSTTIQPMDPDATNTGDDAYMSHTRGNRVHGPKFPTSPTCIVPGATYYLSGRARFRSKDGVTPPLCSVEGGSNGGYCLEFKIYNRGYLYLGRQAGVEAKFIHDGEWFTFSMKLNAMTAETIGTTSVEFWFWRPEDNVIIDIDWLKMELVPLEVYPPDTPHGCLDLVYGNGDAEAFGNPYPWVSSHGSNHLVIAEEEDPSAPSGVNHFYRLYRLGINWGIWYKTNGFKTPCVVAGQQYVLRLRVRVHSTSNQPLRPRFGWNTGGKWYWHYMPTCPVSTGEWVYCESSMAATEAMVGAEGGYQIWNYLTSPLEADGTYSTIDYDDISFSRYNPATEVHKISVSSEAATCWGSGSQILLTSSTYDQGDAHELTVVETDPTAGTITVDRAIPFTTTERDDPDFPVEVASLTRNFVIEGELDPADELHGGHFIIIHTPSVNQYIGGIEFVNLGQQGSLGRYPLHFHMSGAVEGAIVSKNVIKESHQRGVVIHGTNNLTISENVLYNIKGHGYFLEDGAEMYNRFIGNLASGIYPVATLLNDLSGNVETDKEPSAFWMSNTMNYWEDNVAAGSAENGFWVEPQDGSIRGPSKDMAMNHGMNRQNLNLLHFVNNHVHSAARFGMRLYPSSWTPTDEAHIVNLRCYRNKFNGISMHVDRKVRLLGGVYQDNGQRQIWSNLADEMAVEDALVVGLSAEFRSALARAGKSPRCDNSWMYGVSFSTTRQFGYSNSGMTLKNVSFKNFNCGSDSVAIQAGDEQSRNGDNSYSAKTTFDGLSFSDVTNQITACQVEEQGVHYVAFEDTTGDLNPNGNSVPGFLVNTNNDVAINLAGTPCVDIPGSCLSHCENACLQTVNVIVDSQFGDLDMVLTDDAGTENILSSFTTGDATYTLTHSKYSASVAGGTFAVTFRDALGETVYPNYAIAAYEGSPQCTQVPTPADLSIYKPSPGGDRCNELIKNTDLENGIDGFKQFFTGLEHAIGEGLNGSNAIKTTSRSLWNAMLTKYLDVSCLVANDQYTARLSYKVVDSNDNPIDCGTNCPNLKVTYYPDGTLSTQSWANIADVTLSTVEGWNTIEGTFTVTEAIANSLTVHVSFYDSSRSVSGQFIVDDFSMTKI